MKIIITILLLAFGYCISPAVNAQEQQKPAAAVMELKAMEGVSQGAAAMLTNYLRTQLVNTKKFTIVTRENMEEILNEQKFQYEGCTSRECVVQAGKLLGVRKMFTGTIGKLGNTYQIDISLIDVESGRIERAESEICPKCEEEALYISLRNIINKIAGISVEKEKIIYKEKESTQSTIKVAPVTSDMLLARVTSAYQTENMDLLRSCVWHNSPKGNMIMVRAKEEFERYDAITLTIKSTSTVFYKKLGYENVEIRVIEKFRGTDIQTNIKDESTYISIFVLFKDFDGTYSILSWERKEQPK